MRVIYRLLIIGIVIGLMLSFSYAQENEYTVMTKSGDVFLINRVSKDLTDLHIGDKLNYHDNIQLNLAAYIVLVDTNLQSVELFNEGQYNISTLDTMFTVKRNTITENITKFILNEMSTSSAKYNDMKTLGAVVRNPLNVVEVAVPKFGNIEDSVYSFSWYPLPKDSGYIFRIFNQNGNSLYMNEIFDTSITLDLSNFNFQFDNEYYWSVFDKTSFELSKDSVSFKLISPKHKEQIYNEVENLKKDFLIKKSPFNNFIIARYLLKNELNESAIKYFEKCIQIAPMSEFYWAEYIQFLIDVGLSRKAMNQWNKSPFNMVNINNMD
jgi:hypothetical protein